GWYGLRDAHRGVWAGLTDFWQQSPAELEVDGDVLRLHLWPARGVDPLDLRPSAQLGPDYPGNHRFHNRWYVNGLDEMTQAYGLAKTHNLRLRFFDAPNREAARRQVRMRCVEPVLALPDPAYICESEVMHGRLHPHDPERFPAVEALVDSVVDFYYNQRETAGQYGWIHFGDVYNTGDLWRRWAAMFYGFPNVMPRLYLRSGRRDVWDFHRVNARHVMDIDMCHLDHAEFGKWRGGRYGGDGGIAHYAADIYTMGPDHHVEFMFQDYYINGNLRALEVAREMLRAHADRRDDRNMTEYRHRGTGGALRFFSLGYQATWDPEYLSIMRQVADVLYDAQERLGVIRHDDVYMNQGLILYYQLTGEERMRELFLDNMRTLSRRRNIYVNSHAGRGSTFSGLAHAYWFTADESFLPFLLWQLELAQESGLSGLRGNRLAINATHGSTLPEAMAILAAVDPLPAAAGPAIMEPQEQPLALSSNWAFYLLQETDAAFSVTLDVDLYSQARSFPNWQEWVAQ
ncbi:MAG: hypothetical protein LC725_13045, partial [Lentisphaerae bacterium]|nr:hypothetical protein [Lentisphaerota bacterium]